MNGTKLVFYVKSNHKLLNFSEICDVMYLLVMCIYRAKWNAYKWSIIQKWVINCFVLTQLVVSEESDQNISNFWVGIFLGP